MTIVSYLFLGFILSSLASVAILVSIWSKIKK